MGNRNRLPVLPRYTKLRRITATVIPAAPLFLSRLRYFAGVVDSGLGIGLNVGFGSGLFAGGTTGLAVGLTAGLAAGFA